MQIRFFFSLNFSTSIEYSEVQCRRWSVHTENIITAVSQKWRSVLIFIQWFRLNAVTRKLDFNLNKFASIACAEIPELNVPQIDPFVWTKTVVLHTRNPNAPINIVIRNYNTTIFGLKNMEVTAVR